MNRRIATGLLLVVGLAGVTAAAWVALQPRTPGERLEAARQIAAGIHVTSTTTGSSLLATSAIADFGIGADVRLVRVRIVDELRLELRIQSDLEITLAAPPRLCLVGPFSAPDDAGLSDRCWGEPDLSSELAQRVETRDGRPSLAAGRPIDVSVTLRRGDVRCDYPPGAWQLEVWVAPVIDGVASEDVLATTASLKVPFVGSGPLTMAPRSRYCGLANGIYQEQGEPDVVTP